MATGSFLALTQPFRSHFSHQPSRKQCTTYVESLTTSSGPAKVRTASNVAVSSIRWLVVWASYPAAYGPSGTTHAHPPGPGLPEHAPSV